LPDTPLPAMTDRLILCHLARRLAAPVLTAARGAGLMAVMPVETAPGQSRDRRGYSGLEAVGRLLCGLAPLLEQQLRQAGPEEISLADVHHLIDVSTDPTHPQRLNFTKGDQPLVDAAFLAQAVMRAPRALWSDLAPRIQDNLATALAATREIKPHFNNWLLFSAIIEAALCRMGRPWDRLRVDYALRQHEQWYVGDGLYSDGPHFRWDYYNSYVIQPMLLDILQATVPEYPAWGDVLNRLLPRMARYAEILERMIGPDGSFPPIGRSLSYRCAAFQALAQLALHEALPPGLSPSQVRSALMAVIVRSLGDAQNYDAGGWLRIGLNGAQPELGEGYISTGSLYLCSTAFLPLGLPTHSEFWSLPGQPWTQKRLWTLGEALMLDKAYDI